MPIDIECPGCRAEFQVPERLVGKRIRCKTCREEFRVDDGEPDDDYHGEPRPRRSKSRSPWLAVAIVGGILVGCLVIAVVVVGFIGYSIREAPAQQFVVGRPQAKIAPLVRNAVRAEHTIPRLRPPGQFGRPVTPAEGPIVVTLSNPRRAANSGPGQPIYQVDYKMQGAPAGGNDWFYLVVKAPAGVGEAVLFKLNDKSDGTLNFDFFPGSDPGSGFEAWLEREPFGKHDQRKRVSKPVTVN